MFDLTVNEYQEKAKSTAQYPSQGSIKGLIYTTLGLAGEAGEVANDGKKILRGDDLDTIGTIPGSGDSFGWCAATRRERIIDELGDVAWYLAMIATELNIDLAVVLERNLDKLAKRLAEGNIKGKHEA